MQALDSNRSNLRLDPGFESQEDTLPGTRSVRPANDRPSRSHARLLPTLFDRLRDDSPLDLHEADNGQAVTAVELRRIVQRDLGLLLNTTNAEDLIDRARHPEVAVSTLNYGVPPLAGSQVTDRKWDHIEGIIRRAIHDFEPRLIPDSVSVSPLAAGGSAEGYNVLMFEIRAMIRQQPCPIELMVQSSVDLETNRMRILQTSPTPVRRAR